jgi:hypothetical protein
LYTAVSNIPPNTLTVNVNNAFQIYGTGTLQQGASEFVGDVVFDGVVSGPAAGPLKIQTSFGYISVGPLSSSKANIQTDRSSFFFNKAIQTNVAFGTANAGFPLKFRTLNTDRLIINDVSGQVTVPHLAGTGDAPLRSDSLGNIYRGSSTVSDELTISGESFNCIDTRDDASLGTDATSNGFAYLLSAVSAAGILAAPVNLPTGAIVTGFTVIGKDNSTAQDLVCVLLLHKARVASYTTIATAALSGSLTGIREVSVPASHTVDNHIGALVVHCQQTPTSNTVWTVRLKAVTIAYQDAL